MRERNPTHQVDEVVALGVREEAAVEERPARAHTPVTVSQTKIVKPQAARAAGEADRRFTCGVRIAG